MPLPEAHSRTSELAARCEAVTVTRAIVLEAFRIRQRHGYGFFDSQVIASALASNAGLLYSEDLHHGQMIDGVLRIVSPFAPAAHQRRPAYRATRTAQLPILTTLSSRTAHQPFLHDSESIEFERPTDFPGWN